MACVAVPWTWMRGILDERVYYPVGSGFVVDETAAGNERIVEDTAEVACPFRSVIQE